MADAGQDLQQLIQNYHECRATLVNHDTEQAQAKATWEEAKTLLASSQDDLQLKQMVEESSAYYNALVNARELYQLKVNCAALKIAVRNPQYFGNLVM